MHRRKAPVTAQIAPYSKTVLCGSHLSLLHFLYGLIALLSLFGTVSRLWDYLSYHILIFHQFKLFLIFIIMIYCITVFITYYALDYYDMIALL